MNSAKGATLHFQVWLVLLLLLGLTRLLAEADLGRWGLPVALAIAFAKLTLIALFYMNLRQSTRLTRLFAAAGFLWFFLMLLLTLTDYLSRPYMP